MEPYGWADFNHDGKVDPMERQMADEMSCSPEEHKKLYPDGGILGNEDGNVSGGLSKSNKSSGRKRSSLEKGILIALFIAMIVGAFCEILGVIIVIAVFIYAMVKL